MAYNFTITLRPYGDAPDAGTVLIDPAARYGYWERRDGSEGGGLWFDHDAPGLLLVDYDGAFDLPRAVWAALRAHGVDTSEMECEE